MIFGTAGHIDHGKTTLVRALTGVDTDRLQEEKARGISIELGYAYADVPHDDAAAGQGVGVLGIIDVPGHEKFVHTMAAGASGIDHVLLVVAADDGVMPQTREHLAIVELFGIAHGTVVLTKTDRADAARIAAVRSDIEALLAASPLRGAPVFETAITTTSDIGVQALRDHLFARVRQWRRQREHGLFRLAVDRVFTLAGHGTVVTGTVFGGRVAVGDSVTHSATGRSLRVRGLHAQNHAATEGVAGERVALNLVGLDRQEASRGDWIADARVLQATRRIDVRARLLADAPPLAAWTPVHLHLGAAHRQARVVPLQGDVLAPGAEALLQLVLDAPVFVVPGDRLILRNAQGDRTIGGGAVLDPQAPERRRRSAARMAWLSALEHLVDRGDAGPLLALAPAGLSRSGLARLTGRWPATDWAGPDTPVFALGAEHADLLWLAPAAWAEVRRRIVDALDRHHATAPDDPGLNEARLRRIAFAAQSSDAQLPAQAWHAWIERLLAEDVAPSDRALERSGPWLHRPGHRPALSDKEQALAARLLPLMEEGGADPPWVRDLARASGAGESAVRELLRKQARAGVLYQVVKDLFYPATRIAELAAVVAGLAARSEIESRPFAVEVGAFRDAVGLGRKRAIQILEFFDRVGYTRRVGETRWIRPGLRWTEQGPVGEG
ncbi:selenocysteine-specific translation elongation factor [Xylophilus sp. GOD-11R]|uniref:selenocysteine-specific translation elongation factor n=1 Tax=Xylophilus sp. GOD-11R TaxID=3089814 RepID=UPI00298D4035|nr:selenocysteine-specific translation elongation factor [Xylophilus sp. GOD-11R]WPB57644.1 selenocysteine-specific translation elongation factor [Xylophilus sp. GOD-11R]